MEGSSEGIQLRLDMPQKVPAVGRRRGIRKDMDQAAEEIRRCQGNQVEVAIVGFQFGEGTFRGDSTGPNPTDRGKLGTKRHILTDQRGTPLSAIITGANTHDMKAATDTLDGIVVQRPPPRPCHRPHLCLDKGYDFPEIEAGVIERFYVLTCATEESWRIR